MQVPFSALLLAGGKSSRMGRDKALLEMNGELLWQRQLRILRALQPNETFITGALETECETIPDAQPDAGPLGGLVAGLRRCPTPLLVVLAVDLPRMTTEFLAKLLVHCSETEGAIVHSADRYEPLAAVYPRTALPLAERRLTAGDYALRSFAGQCIEEGLLRRLELDPAERSLFHNLNTPRDLLTVTTQIVRANGDSLEACDDYLSIEEPLEIRIEGHSVAVVMRTPGSDRELVAGFLVTEKLVSSPNDIFEIARCGDSARDQVVDVTLRDPRVFDRAKLTRNLFSSSSCGVCGKATIEAVRQSFPPIVDETMVAARTLRELPTRLRENQEAFSRTGGLHACALFDSNGQLQILREDVGRHNALDKIIGRALLDGELPLRARILFLSGRVSFEMMQKALAAGIPIVAAISAPSSLAVEFARESNQTLVGFVRGETMNIYAGRERIRA